MYNFGICKLTNTFKSNKRDGMKNKLAYHPNQIAKGFTIILTLEYNFLHFLGDMIIQSLMQDSAELNLSTNKKLHLGGWSFPSTSHLSKIVFLYTTGCVWESVLECKWIPNPQVQFWTLINNFKKKMIGNSDPVSLPCPAALFHFSLERTTLLLDEQASSNPYGILPQRSNLVALSKGIPGLLQSPGCYIKGI